MTTKELKKVYAAYAAYGVGVFLGTRERDLTAMSFDSEFIFVTIYSGAREKEMRNIHDTKLILRPMSDLTKEIELNNGEKFVPMKRLNDLFDFQFDGDGFQLYDDMSMNYHSYSETEGFYFPPNFWWEVYQKLLEWHFDVFGLLDKNLAVDINTVK